ncbi:MAG: hypothetical protein KAG96_04305 [Ichthyobacteriaceae bacterium]|nr:hypothetical protein [Ichthyobacteriaceae bacterium]
MLGNQPINKVVNYLQQIELYNIKGGLLLLSVMLLSVFNWLFEIIKWKELSASVKNITYTNSAIIVLSSFAVSIFTPNRVGEYGAKVLYYNKTSWKNIVSLNLLSNLAQLFVTVFVAVALFGFLPFYPLKKLPEIIVLISVLLLIIGLIYFFARYKILAFYKKIRVKITAEVSSKTKIKVLILSFLKYFSFFIQFLMFLAVLNVDINITIISILGLMYFMVSVVPTIFLGDFLVRGSVALFLFTQVGVEEIVIISVVLLAWISNFLIPALIGAILLMFHKPNIIK